MTGDSPFNLPPSIEVAWAEPVPAQAALAPDLYAGAFDLTQPGFLIFPAVCLTRSDFLDLFLTDMLAFGDGNAPGAIVIPDDDDESLGQIDLTGMADDEVEFGSIRGATVFISPYCFRFLVSDFFLGVFISGFFSSSLYFSNVIFLGIPLGAVEMDHDTKSNYHWQRQEAMWPIHDRTQIALVNKVSQPVRSVLRLRFSFCLT